MLSVFYSLSSQASSCAVGSVCGYCGQYPYPCKWIYCDVGATVYTDPITKLSTSAPVLKNSAAAAADTDGCPDNYPANPSSLPFTINLKHVTTLPDTVPYSTKICTCH